MTPLTPIPCLVDNYAWLLDELGVVVDPSEPGPVLAALAGRPLRGIWLTHHHWDHVGGVGELITRFPGIPVVAGAFDRDRIAGLTDTVVEGDRVGPARILEVPGHTLGAVAWVLDDVVFTGDTLFQAGCGRLFEGDPETMVRSLTKLRALPDGLRMACGHDYSARNLGFARTVDPGLTRQPCPPPGDLGEEKRTNPFLRWDDPALAGLIGTKPGVPTFFALRTRRDSW